MNGKARRLAGLAVALAVTAAACGGDDDNGAEAGDEAGTPDAPEGDGGDGGGATLTAAVAEGWTATALGDGIKPALALDGAGAPAAVWLSEEVEGGFVDFASSTDGWAVEQVAEGYFYGPIDIAFDDQDRPNVVWHDHEDVAFDQEKGNLAYGLRDGDAWAIEPADDDGHDGWDSTLVVGEDGTVLAAGVDPAQFGRSDGVEFYERAADGTWTVTPVGSGPIDYEFNVALATSPGGNPALSWFDTEEADLTYAERIDGEWQQETVATEGDVGRYSSLAFDSQGRPHLSFFEASDTDPAGGRVLHAVRADGQWTIEEVGTLDDFEPGMSGARRNSAIAIGPGDQVQVAFTDKAALQLATRGDSGWATEEVLAAGDRPLGQQVSFELGDDGTPHLATYEVTGAASGGLTGVIAYLTLS